MTRKRTVAAILPLAALLLSLLLPVSAEAGGNERWTVASTYCQSDTLYTYIEIPEGQEDMEVSLAVDQTINPARKQPEKVEGGDTTVHYLLLIDLSTSMANYRYHVQSFVSELLSNETQPVVVDIAGIGEEFVMLKEGMTTSDEVLDVVNDLLYRQTASDISGGVKKALQYLAEHPQKGGTLLSMLLLTDGIPYGSKDLESEAADLEEIAGAIRSCPESIVHTVGFARWDPEVLDAVSEAAGGHHDARTVQAAGEAGKAVAGYTDRLYGVDFPLKWPDTLRRIDARLVLTEPDNNEITMIAVSNIRNLDLPLEEAAEPRPVLPSGGKEPGEEDPADGGEEPADGEKPADGEEPADGEKPAEGEEPAGGEKPAEGEEPADGEKPAEGEEPAGGEKPAEGEEPAGEEPPSGEEAASGDKKPGEGEDAKDETASDEEGGFLSCIPLPWLIAGIAVVAVLIAAVIFLCIRGGKKKKPAPGGIAMRLDILAGQCRTNPNVSLSGQLSIGSDKGCDIVFPELPPHAARISLFDQQIYLEETDPQVYAAIGGMRIQGPNRLRSGDEVSLGAIRFRILF